jgi:hypothetical protein
MDDKEKTRIPKRKNQWPVLRHAFLQDSGIEISQWLRIVRQLERG